MSEYHQEGTEVQLKNGRVVKKLSAEEIAKFNAKTNWIGRGRYTWMTENGARLEPDQRVFHIDGDKANDNPDNLIPIRFGGPVYKFAHAHVVYRPKTLTQKQRKVTIKA